MPSPHSFEPFGELDNFTAVPGSLRSARYGNIANSRRLLMRHMPLRDHALLLCVGFIFLGLAGEASAEPFDLKAHYDKAEYRIPMRDGVKLFVAVYTPKDKSQRYPILMRRTPYSIQSYGPQSFQRGKQLAPAESLLRDGYIFVLQDVRGRYKSEGEWEDFRPLRTNPDRKSVV